MVFVDEGRITNFASSIVYNEPSWRDLPPLRHGDGTNVSFADGHTEYWKWRDPRTTDLGRQVAGTDLRQPGNPDMLKVQKAVWGQWGYAVSF